MCYKVFENRLLKNKIYDHGLSPLFMQSPYSKFILAIKMLIFDRFSKHLQALLRQIEIQMLNKNILPTQSKFLAKKTLSEVSFYTIGSVHRSMDLGSVHRSLAFATKKDF